MFLFNVILLVLASAVNILLGIVALIKNPRNWSNRLFFLLTLVLVAWTLANFISISVNNDATVFAAIKTIISLVVLQNSIYLYFVLVFPDGRLNFGLQRQVLRVYGAVSLIIFMASVSGMLFEGFTLTQDGVVSPIPTPLIALFILHAAISIITAVWVLISRIRHSAGTKRNQLRFLIIASTILFVIVPLTNFVLPLFFEIFIFAYLSPIYALLFAAVIAYTMIKHNLLDFSAVVARTTTYALTITVLLGVYILIGIVLPNTLLDDSNSTGKDIIIFTVALMMAVAAHPLKLFFDRATNRVFFKEDYDTQVLLDELNQTLVADVDVESILEKTAKIIEDNLKTAYCGFYIRETAYFPSRYIAKNKKKIPQNDLEKIRQITPEISRKLYSVETVPESNEEAILIELMKKNEVEVLGRLVSTLKYEVAGVGYLILGQKRSGDAYTSKDLQLIEIITNELVLAVENALRLEEIEKFNVTLQKKIDEATKELKESNDKLKALDEAKDEFVSMASHQLRTPLTSIKGYISMVLEEDAGKINETQKKMLGQAFFSSQRMVYLISDLLNVSRLKTGKFIIEPRPVNLADLVESELNQLQEGAIAKSQTLTFTKPKDFPVLKLDDMKIRQVVMNFTDNAMYYTPIGGKITIELKDKKDSVEFTVKDSGIGVPKKEQPKLFTKFYRAENARKARPDGTGLGLFMAKKVVVAQGGAIIFSSKEGKGSTFGFSFPKEKLLVEDHSDKK